MSRIVRSLRNILTIWFGQLVSVLCTFIVRMVFVRCLSQDYLGLETLFGNVLAILALAELGIGSAIVYSLYEPLAKNDTVALKSIMRLFRRAYTAIGVVIAALGLLTAPHIELLINDAPDIPELRLYYLFFVFNSAISYFFSYKGSLITADQKNYVVALIRYVFQILLSVFQIIVLIAFGSYFLFLSCMLLATLLQNVAISVVADKMYPFLKDRDIEPVGREVLERIKKNIAGLVIHKLSSVASSPVNGVVLSFLTSLSTLAIYGNYLLVVNALAKIVDQMFDSIISSVGNMGVTETSDRQYEVFGVAHFINAFMFGSLTACLLPLVNLFIEFAFGGNYLFPFHVCVLFALWFYVRGTRDAVLSFISAYGLYWQTRIKALVEAVLLIVLGVFLTYSYGVEGLLVANILVQSCVSLVMEALILHKNGLGRSAAPYFANCLKYAFATLLIVVAACAVVFLIPGGAVFRFLVGGVAAAVLAFGGFALMFWRSIEFQEARRMVLSVILPLLKKINLPKRGFSNG